MPPDRKSVAVSVLALIIAIIATYFSYRQYIAARDSTVIAQKNLDIVIEQLKDARAGAAAADARAERIMRANEDLAVAARLQAEGIIKSVEVGKNAARAAEKSADIASQTMVISSQAYVATTVNFSSLTANEDMDMELVFTNDGNSPATISANYVVRVHFTPTPPPTKENTGIINKITIMPHSKRIFAVKLPPMNKTQLELLKMGELYLLIYSTNGECYTVGGKRPFSFCFRWDKLFNNFGDCSHHTSLQNNNK